MFATAGDSIRDLGAVFAAIGAVVVTFGVLTKARPVRWVFRKLVSDPVTEWHRAQTLYVVESAVAPIYEQLKPIHEQLQANGGSTLRDRVDVVERLVRQQGIGDDIQP